MAAKTFDELIDMSYSDLTYTMQNGLDHDEKQSAKEHRDWRDDMKVWAGSNPSSPPPPPPGL